MTLEDSQEQCAEPTWSKYYLCSLYYALTFILLCFIWLMMLLGSCYWELCGFCVLHFRVLSDALSLFVSPATASPTARALTIFFFKIVCVTTFVCHGVWWFQLVICNCLQHKCSFVLRIFLSSLSFCISVVFFLLMRNHCFYLFNNMIMFYCSSSLM